jgi:hypothetical protein
MHECPIPRRPPTRRGNPSRSRTRSVIPSPPRPAGAGTLFAAPATSTCTTAKTARCTSPVLHEYSLTATIDAATDTLHDCIAVPHVLPWDECPLAAVSAQRLDGERLDSVRDLVRRELRGTGTCTHLNDPLGSLAISPSCARCSERDARSGRWRICDAHGRVTNRPVADAGTAFDEYPAQKGAMLRMIAAAARLTPGSRPWAQQLLPVRRGRAHGRRTERHRPPLPRLRRPRNSRSNRALVARSVRGMRSRRRPEGL